MNAVVCIDMKELGETVNTLKSAWTNKDYGRVACQSRKLLEIEPENVYGLIYLARAAAAMGEWSDLAQAGYALTRFSPRDAFNAARKLNAAGQPLAAAKIFSNIDLRADWCDENMIQLAWKEAHLLLKAGQLALKANDVGASKKLWLAGLHLAPRSPLLRDRVRQYASEAKALASVQDLSANPAAYMEAWREVLWFNPSDAGAAARIARACELSNEKDAVACWLKVIAINPAHEKANARLRKLVQRHDLEDHVIRGLVEMGRDEHTDPFIREFAENRDAKARIAHERFMKTRLREALMRARAVDRTSHPRLHLELWKNVLMLDPKHSAAARKVINSARQLRDYSELVDGLMAHLEITPGDFSLAERLAQAAMRAGHEERVLEYLARHRMMDLSMRHMENLQKRVLQACRNAMRVADFEHALNCFRALELADHKFPPLESLRPVLIQRSASKAKEAEKQGNLGVAVPLAQKVLQIAPDQPGALTVVARDLWRHRRFSDLVELCGPRVKAGPKYAYVQKLLDQAAIKMAA